MGTIRLLFSGLLNKTGRNWGEAWGGELVSPVFPGASRLGSSSHLGMCMQVVEEGLKDDRDPDQNHSSILPKTEPRAFPASGPGQIPELPWPVSVPHSHYIRT